MVHTSVLLNFQETAAFSKSPAEVKNQPTGKQQQKTYHGTLGKKKI